jgi:hypothetical protein
MCVAIPYPLQFQASRGRVEALAQVFSLRRGGGNSGDVRCALCVLKVRVHAHTFHLILCLLHFLISPLTPSAVDAKSTMSGICVTSNWLWNQRGKERGREDAKRGSKGEGGKR